jgi:hypothetical protein
MRPRIFALALIPALTFFAAESSTGSAAFDPTEKYAPSVSLSAGNGILAAGVVKECTVGELYKNVDPFISGGSPGDFPVVRTQNFVIDGEDVELVVTWQVDNSFSYEFGESKEGVMHEIGVENNSDKFIYKYDVPVSSDSGLNVLLAGGTSEKVNHVDICISPADTEAPDVSIRVEPSSDGTTIFGIVDVVATIIDASLPGPADLSITIVSDVDGTDVTPDFAAPTASACDPVAPDCIEYTYSWDTKTVAPGVYTITIDAADTSAAATVGTGSITVTVSLDNCAEGNEGVPSGEFGEIRGCNPSGFQLVELPQEIFDNNPGLLDGKTLTQVAAPALPSAQTDLCGGPEDALTGERPFQFVALDPRWEEVPPGSGEYVYNARPLDVSEAFDLAAVIPGYVQPLPAEPPLFEVRSDTRGEKCIAFIYGDANFRFADFYDGTASLFGAFRYTYAVTQLPETPELGLTLPPDVGPLGPNQIDLQKVPEATYSPTDRFLETFPRNQLGPFTSDVFNPSRVRVPDFSGFLLGTVQICESLLASGLEPSDGRAYYEAVLQCSTDLAVEYFEDLDLLLSYVGDPSLPDYPDACLVDPSANQLRTELNRWRSMIKTGNWPLALTRGNNLLLDVEQATWLVDDRNCPGHVEMRIRNLLWRTAQLQIAEGLLPAQ